MGSSAETGGQASRAARNARRWSQRTPGPRSRGRCRAVACLACRTWPATFLAVGAGQVVRERVERLPHERVPHVHVPGSPHRRHESGRDHDREQRDREVKEPGCFHAHEERASHCKYWQERGHLASFKERLRCPFLMKSRGHVHIRCPARCLEWRGHRPARCPTPSISMEGLLIILLATLPLSLRAALSGRRSSIPAADSTSVSWLIYTFAP